MEPACNFLELDQLSAGDRRGDPRIPMFLLKALELLLYISSIGGDEPGRGDLKARQKRKRASINRMSPVAFYI